MAKEESIASEVVSACLGGCISASILYPLEVLKTKMQALQQEDSDDDVDDDDAEETNETTKAKKQKQKIQQQYSMIQFARLLYAQEGASVFFRGIETSAFQSALEKACYFFAYTSLKSTYSKVFPAGQSNSAQIIQTLPNLLLGCAAEWAHLPLTLPVDAWTTQIQTNTKNQTPLQILLHMLSDKNRSFYSGIQAYWLLCWKPALQYTVYEQVKDLWLQRVNNNGRNNNSSSSSIKRTNLTAPEAFLLGMIARTVATVLVFPFLRAKVLLQTSSSKKQGMNINENDNDDGENDSKKKDEPPSILDLLWELWQRQGLPGLYQGLGPELTRGIFSAALMLMIKERISAKVRQILS